MCVYGYIRVSCRDQNEIRQLYSIEGFGVEPQNIYIDKQSGKDFNRPQYKKLIKKIRRDDLIVVKSIDRLGRNYDEIIEQWRLITKIKGADIFVIDFPLLDTRIGKDLTGTFIADLVLQILSYVAQTEREFIHQRQAEGIAAAKAKGVKFGRPKLPESSDFNKACLKYKSGELSLKEAARACNMPSSTFYAKIKRIESVK